MLNWRKPLGLFCALEKYLCPAQYLHPMPCIGELLHSSIHTGVGCAPLLPLCHSETLFSGVCWVYSEHPNPTAFLSLLRNYFRR